MFEIGDLVRHKPSGLQRDRENPRKRFGIVVSIEKAAVQSMWGLNQDMITVRWMPWNQEQKLTEVLLEHMVKAS